MSSFTSPLVVSPMPDGKRWVLYLPFTYHMGSKRSNRYISVPKDFLMDFASLPKLLLWLLPYWAKFNKASVLHDYLYRVKQIMGKPVTRKEADDIWLEAMLIEFREYNLGKLVAYLEYYSVRWFAWLAWKGEIK
jgi:hypothetical protein